MNILSFEEKEILTSQALSIFLGELSSLAMEDSITIGLSGGTSLVSFYEALRESYALIQKDLRDKIRFAFLDERLVPLDDPESNYRLLSRILFTPLLEKKLITRTQILPVQTGVTHPDEHCTKEVPKIDIGLVGVGPDGHIASLFPNHPGLSESGDRFIVIHNSPKPPTDRISVSVPYIQKIPKIFLFFIGESKRGAYKEFLNPETPPKQCPAKYLYSSKDITVVTDLKE